MNAENAVVEPPVDTSQDDFDSGFSGVEPTPTPAPTETDGPIETPSPAEPPTETPPAEPEFMQLTRQEVETLRSKAAEVDSLRDDLHRKVSGAYGKMGTLEQQLQQLRNAGRKVEITDEMLAEDGLNEYPELATGIKKLLTRVLSQSPTPVAAEAAVATDTTGQPTAPIEDVVEQKVAQVRHELAIEALKDRHPDFDEVRKAPAYADWVKTLPAETQEQIRTSVNPYFAARVMDNFKAAAKKKTETATTRQKIMEAAATPRGTTGSAPSGRTADDEFNEGFETG